MHERKALAALVQGCLLYTSNAALEELTADGTIPAIIEKYIPAE